MRIAVLLFAAAACSSTPERAPEARDASSPPPFLPDDDRGFPAAYDPCRRSSLSVVPIDGGTLRMELPVPCRRYEQARDLPRPAD